MATQVEITNTYADRTTITAVLVDTPTAGQDLADWWDEVVFPHTGDGGGGHSLAEAEISHSDRPELIGESTSWMG